MKLLKLVIVDDEAILLQGLLHTYDWKEMGFEVVGTAQSGKQAIDVIQKVRPHVVLTDIRMKQITGLMVMKTIQKAGLNCLFIVLSAYRDFEYAQQACELGAYAYLLKPVEEEKLQETMLNCSPSRGQRKNIKFFRPAAKCCWPLFMQQGTTCVFLSASARPSYAGLFWCCNNGCSTQSFARVPVCW